MMTKTWRGYYLGYPRKGYKDVGKYVYVKFVYKGRVTWTLDYSQAGRYSEKTVRKHDENIRNGVYENISKNIRIESEA